MKASKPKRITQTTLYEVVGIVNITGRREMRESWFFLDEKKARAKINFLKEERYFTTIDQRLHDIDVSGGGYAVTFKDDQI